MAQCPPPYANEYNTAVYILLATPPCNPTLKTIGFYAKLTLLTTCHCRGGQPLPLFVKFNSGATAAVPE